MATKRKEKDRESILENEIDRLNKVIKEKDKVINQKKRVIKQLKSEKNQAMDTFIDTEHYLREVTDGKPLSEIMNTIKNGKPLNKENEPCPTCGSRDLKTLIYTGFHIKSCSCGYRKKFNEEEEIGKP